jgi:DNA-binding response OmpR family regulator
MNMGASGHILIIDDETAIRHTLARILQRSGYEVTTAGSGGEALGLLSQGSFDLVYLDIRMPDMNGLEALKAIHAKSPEMPVILFTAQPDVNSAVEALRQGAIDYLLKPLQPQTLIDRTQAVLSQREKERRKREIEVQIDALQSELTSLESDGDVQAEPGTKAADASERYLTRGKLVLDLHARRVTVGDRPVSLPPTTFDYLLALARHAPNVVDYRTLVAEAQGYQAESREAQELVKWHVHHIRLAIEPDAHNPTYLINVRGTGYRLVAD